MQHWHASLVPQTQRSQDFKEKTSEQESIDGFTQEDPLIMNKGKLC